MRPGRCAARVTRGARYRSLPTSPAWRVRDRRGTGPIRSVCARGALLSWDRARCSRHMCTELVADALEMAAAARGGRTAGIIFHGDRGSQYLSSDYRELIAELD